MKSPRRLAALVLRRSLRQFLKDRAGTTAIEFAMISVPFLGLIGAILETGMVYFRTAQLQSVTENASRLLLTHNATSGQTNQAFINDNVCTWKSKGSVKPNTLTQMFDCDKLMISVKTGGWTGFDMTGADFINTYNSGANITIPAAYDVAIVRIVYPMPVLAGILGGGVFKGQTISQVRAGSQQYNSNWVHMLMGVSAFRVEPN